MRSAGAESQTSAGGPQGLAVVSASAKRIEGGQALIFLSYAKEDGAAAHDIVVELRRRGIDVYNWVEHNGRFTADIEKSIKQATAYVALISPHFLESPWCLREREFALQRENSLKASDED